MSRNLGWLLLLVGGYVLWKQRAGAHPATTLPQDSAALPVGSAAVLLTQQLATSPF
jgi:hypothetical protein